VAAMAVANDRRKNRQYAVALARGFAGAVLFAVPLLMTMEMWWLGFYMDPVRLFLFMLVTFMVLVVLSYFGGFRENPCWSDDVKDALSAIAVGSLASAVMLALLGVLNSNNSLDEMVGKIALHTVPASIGAMVARKQFGNEGGWQEEREQEAPYIGEVFLMTAGALFFAFNVAPTEEMALISYQMTGWPALLLALFSMAALHGLVYSLGFRGEMDPRDCSFGQAFFRFTVVGYAVALLVSLYVLWTFGRTDGISAEQAVMMTVVLGFPAALGAATARLIV
jgi:putative integral membrane protein (TIGR02587 family)